MVLARVTHYVQAEMSCPWISASIGLDWEDAQFGYDGRQQGAYSPTPACPLAVFSQGRGKHLKAGADRHLQALTPKKKLDLFRGEDYVMSCILCRPST